MFGKLVLSLAYYNRLGNSIKQSKKHLFPFPSERWGLETSQPCFARRHSPSPASFLLYSFLQALSYATTAEELNLFGEWKRTCWVLIGWLYLKGKMFYWLFLGIVWITPGPCQHGGKLIFLFLAYNDNEVSATKKRKKECLKAQWLFNYLWENNFHMWQEHQQSLPAWYIYFFLHATPSAFSHHLPCRETLRFGGV